MTKIVKDNIFPSLKTERLILRQMTVEDAALEYYLCKLVNKTAH
jgi:hypothetical protein